MPRHARHDRAALDALLASQDGLVTYAQLGDVKLPASTVAYRTSHGGPWQRLLPGVYLTHNGPPTMQQRARAALLYAGTAAMLTGREALSRHGFLKLPASSDVHVLVPAGKQPASAEFVIVERTSRLPDPVKLLSLPGAPVARAVIDTCRRQRDQRVVTTLIAEAVQRSKCDVDELVAEVRDGQVRGSRLARAALNDVVAGTRSTAEAEARQLFQRGGLPEAQWNHDLYTSDGRFIACPDAWFPEAGVAAEIDSREFHLNPDGWERTLKRHALMSSYGIIVVHITPRRVRREAGPVLQELRGALDSGLVRPRLPIIAIPHDPSRHRRFA
jgi:hypothetical protein